MLVTSLGTCIVLQKHWTLNFCPICHGFSPFCPPYFFLQREFACNQNILWLLLITAHLLSLQMRIHPKTLRKYFVFQITDGQEQLVLWVMCLSTDSHNY